VVLTHSHIQSFRHLLSWGDVGVSLKVREDE
jgi:hypothetical protein